MLEISNEIAVLGSLLLAFAAWLRFGAKPALGTLVAALAASSQL